MFGRFKKNWPAERTELLNKIAQLSKEGKPETIHVDVPCTCKDDLAEIIKDKATLSKEITALEKERLTAVRKLKEKELEHKIVVEDIEHMQKILDEKNALEVDRKIFEGEKAADAEIKKIRLEYSNKLEKELMVERGKMQEFMQKVMEALPNVNVKLSGK